MPEALDAQKSAGRQPGPAFLSPSGRGSLMTLSMLTNILTKRNWLLIGTLIVLSAGMIGAWTYLTKKPTPVVETTPLVEQPEEGTSEETVPPEEEEPYEDARKVLERFLSYLHDGQYEEAAQLYIDSFPSSYQGVTIHDKAEFLRVHCETAGTCLKYKIMDGETISNGSFIFGVQFFWNESGEKPLEIGSPLSEIPREREWGRLKQGISPR